MPMYNLLEQRSTYSDTKGGFWFYFKEEITNFDNGIANANKFKYFKYKAKLFGKTVVQSTPNQAIGILKMKPYLRLQNI